MNDLLINCTWIAIILSCTVTGILFVDLLKSSGFWVHDNKPATENDVFRVVHHLLYDATDKIQDHITENRKKIDINSIHNRLEISTQIKNDKKELIRILDKIIKELEDEKD